MMSISSTASSTSGFSNDDEIVEKARLLLGDSCLRSRIAAAGQNRCLTSRYSVADRAAQMLEELTSAVDCRASTTYTKDSRT